MSTTPKIIQTIEDDMFDIFKKIIELDHIDLNHIEDNYFGNTLLQHAAYHGRLEFVRFLVEKGADIGVVNLSGATSFVVAVEMGHFEIVKFFLERGVPIDDVVTTGDQGTPLYYACKEGHLDIVVILCEYGADVHVSSVSGSTPLFIASSSGHFSIVKYLVERGADVNHITKNGNTSLIIASELGHLNIVRYLYSVGATIDNKINTGATALHYASLYGNDDVIKFLISKGAKILEFDSSKRTAVHYACYLGHFSALKIFYDYGVSIKFSEEVNVILASKSFPVNTVNAMIKLSQLVVQRRETDVLSCIKTEDILSFNFTLNNGDHIFHHILKYYDDEEMINQIIKMMISKGSKLFPLNKAEKYPVDISIERGFLKSAEILSGGVVSLKIYLLLQNGNLELLQKMSRNWMFPPGEYKVCSFNRQSMYNISSSQLSELLFSEICSLSQDFCAKIFDFPPEIMKLLAEYYQQFQNYRIFRESLEYHQFCISKRKSQILITLLRNLQFLKSQYLKLQIQTSQQFYQFECVSEYPLVSQDFIHLYQLESNKKQDERHPKKRQRENDHINIISPLKKPRLLSQKNQWNEIMNPDQVTQWFAEYKKNSEGTGKFTKFQQAFKNKDAESIMNISKECFVDYLKAKSFDPFDIYDLYSTIHQEN